MHKITDMYKKKQIKKYLTEIQKNLFDFAVVFYTKETW